MKEKAKRRALVGDTEGCVVGSALGWLEGWHVGKLVVGMEVG